MIRDLAALVKSAARHLRLTLRALADRVNRARLLAGEPAFVWPSPATLADDTGLSLRTVYRHLAELRSAGIIARAVRAVGSRLVEGWDLLLIGLAVPPVAQTSVTGDNPLPLHEPEPNPPLARAREVGGGAGLEPGKQTPALTSCTTSERAQPREHKKSGGAARREARPKTAEQARAAALWQAYEAHRVAKLGARARPHRSEPRTRDLDRVIELVTHAERTRSPGDRESAWAAVAKYGTEAIDIAEITTDPGTAARDRLEWWRCDGWEWSPDRFDRVLRDVAADVHGKAADAWWAARKREQEAAWAADDAAPKMSAAALAAFVAECLNPAESAAHGQADPA